MIDTQNHNMVSMPWKYAYRHFNAAWSGHNWMGREISWITRVGNVGMGVMDLAFPLNYIIAIIERVVVSRFFSQGNSFRQEQQRGAEIVSVPPVSLNTSTAPILNIPPARTPPHDFEVVTDEENLNGHIEKDTRINETQYT